MCLLCARIKNGYHSMSVLYLCLDTKWISSKLCAWKQSGYFNVLGSVVVEKFNKLVSVKTDNVLFNYILTSYMNHSHSTPSSNLYLEINVRSQGGVLVLEIDKNK